MKCVTFGTFTDMSEGDSNHRQHEGKFVKTTKWFSVYYEKGSPSWGALRHSGFYSKLTVIFLLCHTNDLSTLCSASPSRQHFHFSFISPSHKGTLMLSRGNTVLIWHHQMADCGPGTDQVIVLSGPAAILNEWENVRIITKCLFFSSHSRCYRLQAQLIHLLMMLSSQVGPVR